MMSSSNTGQFLANVTGPSMLRSAATTHGAPAHCHSGYTKLCDPLQELLGDGLHPTAKGLMTIAQCLMPLVNKLASANATVAHVATSSATAHTSFQDVQGTNQRTRPAQTACVGLEAVVVRTPCSKQSFADS